MLSVLARSPSPNKNPNPEHPIEKEQRKQRLFPLLPDGVVWRSEVYAIQIRKRKKTRKEVVMSIPSRVQETRSDLICGSDHIQVDIRRVRCAEKAKRTGNPNALGYISLYSLPRIISHVVER
jgi:hypothetical protein